MSGLFSLAIQELKNLTCEEKHRLYIKTVILAETIYAYRHAFFARSDD